MHISRVDYICYLNSIIIISGASYPPRNCQLKLSEADCNSIKIYRSSRKMSPGVCWKFDQICKHRGKMLQGCSQRSGWSGHGLTTFLPQKCILVFFAF